MTTRRIHACNFCRQEGKDGIRGVIWVHGYAKGLKFTEAAQSENHICTECLGAIRALPQTLPHAMPPANEAALGNREGEQP